MTRSGRGQRRSRSGVNRPEAAGDGQFEPTAEPARAEAEGRDEVALRAVAGAQQGDGRREGQAAAEAEARGGHGVLNEASLDAVQRLGVTRGSARRDGIMVEAPGCEGDPDRSAEDAGAADRQLGEPQAPA